MTMRYLGNQLKPSQLASATALVVATWAMGGMAPLAQAEVNEAVEQENVVDVQEDNLADYVPLINEARLFSGAAGLALDIDVSVDIPQFSTDSATMLSSDEGARYRFDVIPEVEHMSFLGLNSSGTSSYALEIMRAQVAFGDHGDLEDVQMHESVKGEHGAHLVGAVEKALKTLVVENAGLVRSLKDDGVALVVSQADKVVLTVYSDHEPVKALFDVTVPQVGVPEVHVFDDALKRAPVVRPAADKSVVHRMRVVGLLESYKGSISSIVMNYLRGVADSVEYDDVRSKFLQLGHIGEGAWSHVKEYGKPIVSLEPQRQIDYGVSGGNFHFNSYSAQVYRNVSEPVHLKFDMDDGSFIAEAIEKSLIALGQRQSLPPFLSSLTAQERANVHFIVPDKVFDSLGSEWSQPKYDALSAELMDSGHPMLSEMLTKGRVVRESQAGHVKITNVKVVSRAGWGGYIKRNAASFLSGSVIGGGISLGFKAYDKYRTDGRLPHQYSEAEAKRMVIQAGADALRGGVSSLAAFNLMTVVRMPTVVASAAVGAGNSLYDSYRAGKLNSQNLPGTVVQATAESAVAGVGGWVGAGIGSYVPVPGSTTGGALAGSLVGHYVYQYVADNHADIMSSVMAATASRP